MEPQITSMCDILTTLLLFFIATATDEVNQQTATLELPPAPEAQEPGEEQGKIVLNIDVAGAVIFDTNSVPMEEVTPIIEKRRIAWDDRGSGKPYRVIIRADKDTKYEKVKELMQASAAAGVLDVIFAAAEAK